MGENEGFEPPHASIVYVQVHIIDNTTSMRFDDVRCGLNWALEIKFPIGCNRKRIDMEPDALFGPVVGLGQGGLVRAISSMRWTGRYFLVEMVDGTRDDGCR